MAFFKPRLKPGVVRTPTVLQMESLECGAAALGIVLAYHGRYEPLEQLRVRCGVGRDGAKVSNLLHAARSFGLEAGAWSTEASELPKLKAPFMVFWNFNHFVVVEGFADGMVYLNDPASGRRTVAQADFAAAFTGVVLTFARTPEFQSGGATGSLLKTMLTRITSDRPALAFAALAGLFLVIPGMVIPVFTRLFVDRILIDGQMGWFLPILLGLLLSTLLEAGLAWLQGSHLLRLQYKLALSATGRYFWHILHLPVLYFAQRAPGEIASRLSLNESVAKVVSGDLARALINGGLAFFFVAVMLTYDVLLTSISVAVVAISMGAFHFAARRTQELSVSYAIADGRLRGNASNGIAMLETLQASADDSHFYTKYMAQHALVVSANQRMETSSAQYSQVPAFLMMFNTTLILVIGGFRVMDGFLTIGMLIAYQGLVSNFARPMSDLFNVLEKVQRLRGDLQRLDDVLNSAPDPLTEHPVPARPDLSQKLSGALSLHGLRFAYSPQDKPLFDQLDMQVLAGERIGIVGASGAGKSSLARLIAGMYAPDAGEIRFDGVARADHPRELIASSVAHVDQDIQFFEGTIRENLTLWDRSLDEAQMVAAARDALIHDFIMGLPQGYDTRMDENGRNLSGGQRQRLEIARALTLNPRILLLDEATSSLDAASEARILDNCRRRGCTVLLATHRRFVLRSCDRVMVLEAGHVAEEGLFDTLYAQPDSICRSVLEDA
ncbi:NHLP family bacteriocin export ABC transporter peptidase/permease/ATPase subunit [Massilia endophytica]|uniref:NHLP family bacteriocin export ABC transporter peptidase/permease/ATPase subunit n=1 Tax=Massilia endophytica TaxID=2899220 RepID=UPI001E5D3E13|nr:NHLP family bacteriocin export ABC transporter peptidase/permease/ATPase subunit [Massilia endophytica]UGQ48048.1 NHLP family bacteriocin export ABC transporter peptidase/permease/ATPase subunit [Massilia endophytica]